MKYAIILARILLGAAMTMAGLMGLLGTFGIGPMAGGEPLPGDAGIFMGLLFSTKYMAVVKLSELAGGLLILSGRMLPLGLVLVIPVLVNILTFHATMEPAGIVPGAVLSALAAVLVWGYRGSFAGILTTSAQPG
ncbi:MAG: putative oxidoreductase [Myxococcota bacterium]